MTATWRTPARERGPAALGAAVCWKTHGLRAKVQAKLELEWSPEQIAA